MTRDADQLSTVCVFGANDPADGSSDYESAREVGRILAEMGYRVANGGYGGTMEASARGAKEAGGATLGVTCSLWKSSPNSYVDEVIRTHSLNERIQTLIDLGSGGYVVLPGATGTLAELAWVWELACKGFLKSNLKLGLELELKPKPDIAAPPIVCVGEFWRPLVEMMASSRPKAAKFVTLIARPDELRNCFQS